MDRPPAKLRIWSCPSSSREGGRPFYFALWSPACEGLTTKTSRAFEGNCTRHLLHACARRDWELECLCPSTSSFSCPLLQRTWRRLASRFQPCPDRAFAGLVELGPGDDFLDRAPAGAAHPPRRIERTGVAAGRGERAHGRQGSMGQSECQAQFSCVFHKCPLSACAATGARRQIRNSDPGPQSASGVRSRGRQEAGKSRYRPGRAVALEPSFLLHAGSPERHLAVRALASTFSARNCMKI